ncbi:MAG: Sir2 family NAD-dependent protein deacetylase [Flavobacteriaceae bacterium]|nr:Sir2 family NAD-dependent protein deacetylase [Flavobacteriaceae bacterium]
MKKIAVLTGAGISAESGLKTFRDTDGLWEGHNVYEVASPEGWYKNKTLVLDFYNQRRKQLLDVHPNEAHLALVLLEQQFEVTIITQNVDDLHERAGSSHIIHLHGELLKSRSSIDENLVYECKTDINLGDLCDKKTQLRPHIVWFGEMVPMLEKAIHITSQADILIIVGTSMQVYPAANIIMYAGSNIPKYFIDPKPAIQENNFRNLTILAEKASVGVPQIVKQLIG